MPPVLRLLCNVTILSRNYYNRFVLFVKSGKQWAAPPDGGAARRISAQPEQRLHPQPELDVEVEVPPTLQHEPQPQRRQHPQSQRRQHPQPSMLTYPANRAARLRAGAGTGAGGIRGRSTADRAGRLSAAGIAAPLLNKVRERKAAEAAVAGRSHSVFLQKKIWEHPFPCHSMPHVPDACRKTEKPGRHTVVRVLDTKIERKLNAWRTAARGELPSSRTSEILA